MDHDARFQMLPDCAIIGQYQSGDSMAKQAVDEARLKAILKSAIIEALEERRELVRDLLAEALEDIAMTRAIEEGAATETVDPAAVYKILDRKK